MAGAVPDHSHDGSIGKKLRILFVPWDRFPPFRPAAKAIFLHELPKRGHCIDWLIQAADDCPEAVTKKIDSGFAYIGATDPGVGFFHRIHKNLLNFRNACRVFSLARANHYDIFQAKDNVSAAIVALLAARIRRIRFFYWMAYPRAEASLYEGRTGTGRYPLLYRIRGHILNAAVYRLILPKADHVFVQSEQMKRDIAAKGIRQEKMTPVPSSVDLEMVPYAAGVEGGNGIEKGERKWVVYLGTLMRVRRLEFVVRAFSLVLEAEPSAVLIMVGKGGSDQDLTMLQEEAEKLGIASSVVFTGFMEMSDAWEYIRRADVCLSPYFPTEILRSTSPTKLVEYMAMGKAVVANDHPEQSLVIEESKAGLCTPWDERAFASAVIRLLGNPDEAAEMGRRGRLYVEQHRTNRITGDLVERTYARVLGRESSSQANAL